MNLKTKKTYLIATLLVLSAVIGTLAFTAQTQHSNSPDSSLATKTIHANTGAPVTVPAVSTVQLSVVDIEPQLGQINFTLSNPTGSPVSSVMVLSVYNGGSLLATFTVPYVASVGRVNVFVKSDQATLSQITDITVTAL